MLTFVRETWIQFVLYYICMFTVSTTFAASLRKTYDPEPDISYYSTKAEPGFALNEEDMTKFHIWPTGIIPYYIDDFSFDKVLRDKIRVFLDGVNKLTALYFVEIPQPPEEETTRWVLFLNRMGLLGCADHPFNEFSNEGVQRVVLGYDCMNSDENLADIVLSLVGVPPQHNAPNRDEFVDIMEENIFRDKRHLFKKLQDTEWLFHKLTYDVESAGHYGPYKHTSNGKATVQRKYSAYDAKFIFNGPPPPKPKENGFSSQDLLKIAMLYNYILRNRETQVPECSKLFETGSKPVPPAQNTIPMRKPRKKPDQYLGVSENDPGTNGEEYDDELKDDNDNNDSEKSDVEDVGSNENYSKINKNEGQENILHLDDKINDDNKSEYDKDDDDDDDNNSEEDMKEEIEENNDTQSANSNQENENIAEYDSKEDIYNNGSNKKENDKKLDESQYSGVENDKKIKNFNYDSIQEIDSNKEQSNRTVTDEEDKTINKNNELMTYDSGTNNHKALAHKIFNSNKVLKEVLNQPDYRTSDEDKNKYIHEENLK